MAFGNVNVVVIQGNLTRDPELRSLPSGMSVCKIRVAVNERRKINDEWGDYANYFDVTVWGKQGESVADNLAKGSAVVVSGSLRWREWETDDGGKRQAVEINADNVRFVGAKKDKVGGNQGQSSDVPADTSDMGGADDPPASGSGDDDIPF